MAWYGTSEWRGLDGRTTTRTYRLQVDETAAIGLQAADAQAKHGNIVDELDAITAATLQDSSIRKVTEQYQAGLGDLSESALVNVWAEDPLNPDDVLSISQVSVPAPIGAIFLGASGKNYNIVDPSNALLQAFIDALAAGALISDMEKIDVGTAVNGIEDGRRVSNPIPRRRS